MTIEEICEKYDILPTRYEKINALIRENILRQRMVTCKYQSLSIKRCLAWRFDFYFFDKFLIKGSFFYFQRAISDELQ